MHVCVLNLFSCVRLFVILWTVACQVPLYMGFSRQEYWSGLPCPPPGDLPDPGVKPSSPALQVDSLPLSHRESPQNIVTDIQDYILESVFLATQNIIFLLMI